MPVRKSVTKVIAPPADPFVAKLLAQIVEGKHLLSISKGEIIFAQGDDANAIFFVQSGKVKISVTSIAKKEAVLVILNPHSFFGEGALVGQSLRISTATTLEASTVFRVDKGAMLRALRDEAGLSDSFIAAVLVRNIEIEEDLCDQLFNHSEKRLARVLLKLSRLLERDAIPEPRFPMPSHETLAEMVGTTRSRVTFFMNKFRRMGLIDYDNDGFSVRTELLTDLVLHD